MMAGMTPGAGSDAPGGADAESFTDFYRERWRDAARWATALCGDRALGEELAQEGLLRLQPRFGVLDNPDGYLRRTIVNLTREAHRSVARRRWRERTSAAREGSDRPALEPAADVGRHQDPELLTALAHLSHEQRAVLVLRYWADWDEATIAETLDCSRSTVRSHAKRGLDRLRAELEDAR